MQATLHPDFLSLFVVGECHYAHRVLVSEGFEVTFIVMLSKSVDYVQPRADPLVGRRKIRASRGDALPCLASSAMFASVQTG
jgi:hypothetical protein